ncbi:MAG: hypothetical protein MJZ37_07075 [Bacilli bacterium]|nr:hypothetical protein [Bacilli bacterium]
MLTKRQLLHIKSYCRDDITKIENYDKAIADNETWECHHRLELTIDGQFAHTEDSLDRLNMYYHRPYYELILLPLQEHHDIHKPTREKFPGHRFDGTYHPRSEEGLKQWTEKMTGKHWKLTDEAKDKQKRYACTPEGREAKRRASLIRWGKQRGLTNV